MPDIKTHHFSFSHGIDRIVPEVRQAHDLPPSAQLRPAEMQMLPELERILALPGLDDFIIAGLRPELSDSAILVPEYFRHVLASAVSGLRSAAEGRPRAARALGSAAGLLAEEIRLRELLRVYQTALLEV